jgi:AraC family transcriptional regulator of adaptative response/methylated-DNA-[protein]-cysteine methyltransferase
MDNNKHFDLIARALTWISVNQFEQPELSDLSRELGVSPHHLQRVFQEWAGVSPKQFLKSITRSAALGRLAAGESVLDAAIASGLSGPGRLHDLMVSSDALTPGEIRRRGRDVCISHGFGDSLFGQALIAWSQRGIIFLGFCGAKSRDQVYTELVGRYAEAEYQLEPDTAQNWLDRVFSDAKDQPIPVWLRGSPFQLKVWEALLAIPEGTNVTYGQVAKLIGSPGASQAVGNAVGSNPISWIIPCHRVIRQLGEMGGYRWGTATKSAMIGWESTHPGGINPQ